MTTTTAIGTTNSVDSAKVEGRRALKFDTLEEAFADAERLANSPKIRSLGNHSVGPLVAHLGVAIDHSIDGFDGRAPLPIRMVARLLKNRFLKKGMRPGFRLSKARESKAFPSVGCAEGLEIYRAAIARCGKERMTAAHPAFGKLTHEEWYRMHCHHAALHLSFLVPE